MIVAHLDTMVCQGLTNCLTCPMVCQGLNDCVASVPHGLPRPERMCRFCAPWFAKAWMIVAHLPGHRCNTIVQTWQGIGHRCGNRSGLGKPWGMGVTQSLRPQQSMGHRCNTIIQNLANHEANHGAQVWQLFRHWGTGVIQLFRPWQTMGDRATQSFRPWKAMGHRCNKSFRLGKPWSNDVAQSVHSYFIFNDLKND